MGCPYDRPVCANYLPVTQADALLRYFDVERDLSELPPEAYPGFVAPFIRLVDGRMRAVEAGRFGMLPDWNRDLRHASRTYNSRSETVLTLPSFRDAWRRGTRCVIPAWAVYEPRYNEDETHERWRIEKADGSPFGIAGIYNEWVDNGRQLFSYTMLTVNADEHPFYRQFHKPGDEKRMPVFLEPGEYDTWMTCSNADAQKFFRMWPGPFTGKPEARVPRVVKKEVVVKEKVPKAPPAPKATPAPTPPPAQASLF